ncbi:Malate dehydrogenase cytoplasmic [Taenia crassiceps]|uniref:Malate dehydrogenase cytoplasmic n=1 Tax=Taenia crassiceps TaxID=6207 RepID=A0ABR4Q501_9CEST
MDDRTRPQRNMVDAVKVLITAPTRPEAYDLVLFIGQGGMFGRDQPVTIALYDLFAQDSHLQWLVNEALDSGLEPLEDIYATTDPELAFQNVDVMIILDTIEAASYAHKNERLRQCWQIYSRHGEYLDKYGKQTTKIVVAGDPVNTNAFILSKYVPSLPEYCITGLVRMDQNRATFQVANKLNVPTEAVKNVLIWGNAGPGVFVDITHSTVRMENGTIKPAIELINNEHWMKYILQPYVQKLDVNGASKQRRVRGASRFLLRISSHYSRIQRKPQNCGGFDI